MKQNYCQDNIAPRGVFYQSGGLALTFQISFIA
jgi:hypothetical protein